VGRPRGDTRERLVAAAFEALRTRGYKGTSTRAVGAIGGLNPALVFYYFDGLDDLLVAALAESSAQRLERYREAVTEAGSLAGLVDVLGRIYRDDVESGHITAVSELVAAGVSNAELGARVLALLEPWLDLAESALAGLPEVELLRPLVSPAELAAAAVTFYLGANLLTQLAPDRLDVASLLDAAGRATRALDALPGLPEAPT
jgi:AcrR family transcriptional regulator